MCIYLLLRTHLEVYIIYIYIYTIIHIFVCIYIYMYRHIHVYVHVSIYTRCHSKLIKIWMRLWKLRGHASCASRRPMERSVHHSGATNSSIICLGDSEKTFLCVSWSKTKFDHISPVASKGFMYQVMSRRVLQGNFFLAVRMPASTHYYLNFLGLQWVTHAMNLTRRVGQECGILWGHLWCRFKAMSISKTRRALIASLVQACTP